MIDPSALEIRRDPLPIYARLRDAEGVRVPCR
jgi:hypothetical protein